MADLLHTGRPCIQMSAQTGTHVSHWWTLHLS